MCFHSNTTSTPGVYCIALVWGDSLFPPGLTRKMMKNQLTTERRRSFQLGQDVRRGGFPLDWWVVRQLVVYLASVKVWFSKIPSRHLLMGPMQFPCSSLVFLAPIMPRYAAHVGKNPYWQPGRKKSNWHAAHFEPSPSPHERAQVGVKSLQQLLLSDATCISDGILEMTRWKRWGFIGFSGEGGPKTCKLFAQILG